MPTPNSWHEEAKRILDREQNRGGEQRAAASEGRALRDERDEGGSTPPPPSIHAFGSGEDYEGRVSASERYINRDLKRLGMARLHEHTVECYDC